MAVVGGGANPPGSPGLRTRRLQLLVDEQVVATGAHITLEPHAPALAPAHVHILTASCACLSQPSTSYENMGFWCYFTDP